ncbi:Outer dense fiber protein 2 [Dissostichus eleginoides]|uniref:Outer dense fiber protein 2 n=1 Tax=Dissostichus eleginoides TaxID=100907 RepID=A0AAD9EWQ0_DISEL|nr:Outer dense fiber protein 2 [Dissostichus eleginoides]
MRTRSSSPPIHLHISDSTPVHVHVKSQRSPASQPQEKTNVDRGNLRPTAKVKTRVPWIPPGKASIRDASYKWEGPTHRLEITPPLHEEPEHSQSALRLADLTSEEEEGLHGRISQYERKIESLLSEVSSLKNEVELRKKEQLLERQSEQLSVSQRVMEQEEQLEEVSKELQHTERENSRLRLSMEKMLEESDYNRGDGGSLQQDRAALHRTLMEAEGGGAAAAQELSALRDSRLSGSESAGLAQQKELLLQKLDTFESTNRTLRLLLREQHRVQMESERVSEQKDAFLKRLADTEAHNAQLVVKLQEKDREANQLCRLLDSEKDNAKSSSDLSKSLESTRAHLQGQLRSKEAENNRLTVQIKNLERAASQQKVEMERLTEQLGGLRRQAGADREALKRATRAQKQRAERSEDTAGQLSVQLLDMKQLLEALSAAEAWQSRHAQEEKDRSKLEVELSLLNSHAAELTEELQSVGDKGRAEREALLERLHALTSQSTGAKLETQALKATASAVEEKLALSQSELQQVKASILQYESLLDSYKIQVGKTRGEADEYRARLAQAERQAQAVRGGLEQELEEVRRELLERLAELEPLPEAVRRSELKLQETQDRERSQERRSMELSTTLTDLRMKAGRSKTLILHFLKDPEGYWTKKVDPIKFPLHRRILRAAVTDTGQSSTQMKAVTDADCSPITIKRHLREKGLENIKVFEGHVSSNATLPVWTLQGSTKHGTLKACSPDLNPIENVWGWMAGEVYNNKRQFQTVDALCEAILITWSNVPTSLMETLASSMPKHIFEVIDNNCGATPY